MHLLNHCEYDTYLLINPNFFSHFHLSKRKVASLAKSGIRAKVLTFVEKNLYRVNQEKYNYYEKSSLVKIIIYDKKQTQQLALLKFTLKEIIKGRKLIFHVLKFNAASLIVMKKNPYFNNRVKIIHEFEGDPSSEYLYSRVDYEQFRGLKKLLKKKHQVKAYIKLKTDQFKVKNSDGLIFMSSEQLALWEARTNKQLNSFILPTLPEAGRIKFSSEHRYTIRKNLKLNQKLVIIYIGNVSTKWQRLDSMCEFIFRLGSIFDKICFLCLVPDKDISIAEQAVSKNNIENKSIIKTIAPEDIYKYLSAADIALFLRHDHLMNNIVTSGKLGEFLASGLPVISTGANAAILNEFMIQENLMIKLSDNLSIDECLIESIRLYSEEKDVNINKGTRLSKSYRFQSFFNIDDKLDKGYTSFIKSFIPDS